MLPEEKRKQLDSIVSQMVANKEDSNAIDFVVNDFKTKYSVAAPQKSFSERTANVLDMVFGGGKVGEAIGTQIAKATAKPEEKQFITPGPSAGEVAGSALQSAALFIPGGKLATAGTKLATKAGIKVGASAIGKIGTGIAAGEVFDIASNLQQGKTGAQALTPGLGAVIGGAIPAAGVAKNVLVRFSDKQAPRIINSLIKPLAKDFSYGKNPGRAVAEEGIIANNFDDLIEKIRTTRQGVGEKIGQLGDTLSTQPVLQLQNSLNPLDTAIKTAASQNNTSLLQRLNNVKRSLTEVLEPVVDDAGNIGVRSLGSKNLDNLTFKEARNLLGEIGDLTSFTGNPTDDKLVNSTLKQIYGSIKGATIQYAKDTNPTKALEFAKLTEKYADLMSAEVATKYRDKIVQRSALIGLSPQTIGIGTGLITAVATGGATIPAVLAGLTGAMADKLLQTPAFKTRLAYLLSTKTQSEVNFLLRKIPALKNFFTTKKGLTPGDVILNKIEETPNKQGGFVANPLAKKVSVSEPVKAKVIAELEKFDTSPIKTNKGLDFGNTDDMFKIDQLKDKIALSKTLKSDEIQDAITILNKNGADIKVTEKALSTTKPSPQSSLLQEAKKYKTTVNIQDKGDLEYLGRILSQDNIADIKAGKMSNFRGTPYEDLAKVNIISETPKTIVQQLSGKITPVKLKTNIFYHGTSAENADNIVKTGFKTGASLPENTFRGGGYGRMQNSISLAETPKDASRFSTLSKNGKVIEVKLKNDAKIVSIKGIEDATDLEDYISYLTKQKIDAVYIGGGEKELVVINPKAIISVK